MRPPTPPQQSSRWSWAPSCAPAFLGSGLISSVRLFFGYSLFYFTLGAIGFLMGAGSAFFLLCGATDTLLWAGLGGAAAGVLLGFIVVKLEKVGVIAAGMFGGVIAALYTNGFVMTHLYNQFSGLNQSWMPYLYAGLLALLGGFLALKLEKLILIVITSFGGAYCMGFGFIRLVWKSTHADIGPLYLFSGNGCEGAFCKIALVVIVGVALLGMFVQLSRTSGHRTRFSKTEDCNDVVVVNSNDSTVLLIHGDRSKGLQL
eukprot:TRINITY_DN66_c0_g1_i1.p1 TRINITY_DN66_c0_g1~~TRINITY_DN66_c0_g1_i1.p1  ORF type:complete len:259 (-),score=38.86 TRINITY_DN66_c0_g1_i1:51-827(-)